MARRPPLRAGYGHERVQPSGLRAAGFELPAPLGRPQWTSSTGGVYSDLPTLKQHVLLMWGNHDVIDPPANDRTIAKQLTHVRTKVFSGAGHAFLFQDAVPVGRAAEAFLAAG